MCTKQKRKVMDKFVIYGDPLPIDIEMAGATLLNLSKFPGGLSPIKYTV